MLETNIEKEIIHKENGEKYNLTIIEAKKIKWNININQKAIIDNNLDIDLIQSSIFNFIYDFIASGNANKIIKDNDAFYWISYQYIIDALPILKINNKDTISRHINKLVKEGLLNKIIIKEFGNKTFFNIGNNAKTLFFGIPSLSNSRVPTQIKEPPDSNQGRVPTQIKDNSYINNTNINTNINDNEILELINLYPAKCNIRKTSTQRSIYDKKKLIKIIKEKGMETAREIILSYISDCQKNNIYIKHFKTFINNFPSLEDFENNEKEDFELKRQKIIDENKHLDRNVLNQILINEGYYGL